MATPLPNVPLMSPITDQSGRLTEAWAKFFLQFYQRAGGPSALSNIELATLHTDPITALQAQVNSLSASVTALTADLTTGLDGLNQGRQI